MWENTPLGKSRPVKPQGLFSSDRCSFVIKTFIQITEGPRAEISQRLHTTPREIIFLLGANERLNLGHLSAVNECIILDRNRYIYILWKCTFFHTETRLRGTLKHVIIRLYELLRVEMTGGHQVVISAAESFCCTL